MLWKRHPCGNWLAPRGSEASPKGQSLPPKEDTHFRGQSLPPKEGHSLQAKLTPC